MKSFYVSVFCLLFCLCLDGQDLIERTQKGLILKSNGIENNLAKSIKNVKSFDANTELFKINKKLKSNTYSEFTDDAVFMNINSLALKKMLKEKKNSLSLSIPVSISSSFDVLLEKVEVLADGYKMETSDGRIIYPDRTKILFYRGIVKGDLNSTVSVSIVEDRFRALISDDHGNYNLGELNGIKGVFSIHNDKKVKKYEPFVCGADESVEKLVIPESIQLPKSGFEKSNVNPCVPIYVEADFKMYSDFQSNTDNVEAHIMAMMNEVSTLYANNTGTNGAAAPIPISLSSTFVWTMQDNYGGDLNTIISEFAFRIKDDYEGRLAHLISTRTDIGGGLGWIDVLSSSFSSTCAYTCNGGLAFATCDVSISGCTQNVPKQIVYIGPYAVSVLQSNVASLPTYSWDVNVFTHEMGHNLGSPHTHACSWPGGAIDNCWYLEGTCGYGPDPGAAGGTIMSYCHLNEFVNPQPPNLPNPGINLSNGFGPLPGQLIFDALNNATVNLECQSNGDCTDSQDIVIATGTITTDQTVKTSGDALSNAAMSTVTINNDAKVLWQSKDNIQLNPVFSIETGSELDLNVADCENNN